MRAEIVIDWTVTLPDEAGRTLLEFDAIVPVVVERGRHPEDDIATVQRSGLMLWTLDSPPLPVDLPTWLRKPVKAWLDGVAGEIEAAALERFREDGRGADQLADYRIADRLEREGAV